MPMQIDYVIPVTVAAAVVTSAMRCVIDWLTVILNSTLLST